MPGRDTDPTAGGTFALHILDDPGSSAAAMMEYTSRVTLRSRCSSRRGTGVIDSDSPVGKVLPGPVMAGGAVVLPVRVSVGQGARHPAFTSKTLARPRSSTQLGARP